WQAKLETVGLRLGLVGNICCAFLFFPVTRGSSLLPLVGLTSEASVKYHIWLGHIVMVLFTSHGLCYVITWISTNHASMMLEWATDEIANLAGEIALLSGLLMWVTTFPRIRRKMFEFFFYTHQLYVVFLLFYLFHVGMSFYCMILPGVYLFMVDRYLRFLQSRRNVCLISARLLPSETIELNFSKSPACSYTPMSTVFINVPSISSLQWHPFTINSSSNFEPEKLSIIIKKEGSWTQQLYQKLNLPSLERLDVSVEGPYGPASVDFLRHDALVMVSGGSGITPFISIIRELMHHSTTLDVPTPTVLLICCFKTSSDLTMLDLLLPISAPSSDLLSKLPLQIQAFVTRETSPSPDTQRKPILTLWFKPHPSDFPISPVLGPNSYLWLASIISSSFAAFLLLISILTRYYIYPIESTGTTYPLMSQALLNLLFVCACIAAASSGVVLWNKKRSSMEVKQVRGLVSEMRPQSSPRSWFCNGDREFESLPSESLAQATTVHYGKRPDLKEMILGAEGSSVGVMASGPSGLRRQVAGICAASKDENVHFESISFTW
ncbi:uncharacterized protein A4U43_C04F24510, partial [Asparagus officinalis]